MRIDQPMLQEAANGKASTRSDADLTHRLQDAVFDAIVDHRLPPGVDPTHITSCEKCGVLSPPPLLPPLVLVVLLHAVTPRTAATQSAAIGSSLLLMVLCFTMNP